jgi:hypothetical protein
MLEIQILLAYLYIKVFAMQNSTKCFSIVDNNFTQNKIKVTTDSTVLVLD